MFQHFMPRADAAPTQGNLTQGRGFNLSEFAKLGKYFNGKISSPDEAESWMEGLEKAFRAYRIPNEEKLAIVEYLMTDEAHNWWKSKNTGNVTWDRFKELFFEKYFPRVVRDQMLSQLLSLKQ